MKYTERDIEKATRLKLEGFNWIATNKNGRPFAYGRMPYRCADDSNEYNIWDNQPGTPWLMLSKAEFTSITWENEPVYIDEIITGVKVQANGDTTIDRLTAENAALQKRLENAVELPCKVGDTVWFFDSGRILKEGKISMLQCKSGGNWKMRITHNLTYSQCKSVFDDYCSKLGIEYFTDRAEAEARLAGLKGAKNDR